MSGRSVRDRLRRRSGGLLVLPVLLFAVPACVLAASARGIGEPAPGNESTSAAAAPAAPPLEVPAGIEPYIYRPTGERADPVNLIFLHTDANTVSAAIERVLRWKPVVASGMSFRERTGTRPTSRQLAAEISPQSRFHIRIEAVPITDLQTHVLASVHRDDTVACGHVGRAFDEMRDLVARAFAEAGYPVRVVELGNTASGLHCDGSRVAGDGAAALIDLSSLPRVEGAVRNRVPGAY